ncbi:sperm acrosome membrane-associated protein 4-like [Anguilla rostrata]|uniref:sperm acrosome membrane-associated protein 4-like n=1 Tax=Anguilla rostrata TaxID=7938 RepID=UPI0030D5D701
MSKILFGIFAVATCFLLGGKLAEALTCNKCTIGLFGRCLIPDTVMCNATQPNCFTGKASFSGVPGLLGFNTQGCLESTGCNSTTNGTILGATYTVTRTCCATDKCNPVVSGAGSVQMSLTAAATAALLACVWSSWQY